ncbi:amidase family protein [Aeromicrobium sp. UC242_57]|uniref:amidase family protein n=1 Tax=Aeromicrobium sp. UC242_57 TaxID=3374624 RepID=UPI00378EA8A3
MRASRSRTSSPSRVTGSGPAIRPGWTRPFRRLAHAWAVERLLADGASVRGITRCDEFAYSLAGTNVHYGTPPNPLAPHRVPGGSSSGSASAVSMGLASIGLGTDTGGSIRVPAAYQGLWGIRTTHGAVPVDGLLLLSPGADTVGWLTRDAGLLARVGRSLLPVDSAKPGELVAVDGLLNLAEPGVRDVVGEIARTVPRIDWPMAEMRSVLTAFRTRQAFEAWQERGAWMASHLHALGPGVRARWEWAASITPEVGDEARREVARHGAGIRRLLGDRVLVLPSASSVAPPLRRAKDLELLRRTTMQLTCVAGAAGLPAVSVPLVTANGLPAGVSLVGPAGSDRALIERATRLNR